MIFNHYTVKKNSLNQGNTKASNKDIRLSTTMSDHGLHGIRGQKQPAIEMSADHFTIITRRKGRNDSDDFNASNAETNKINRIATLTKQEAVLKTQTPHPYDDICPDQVPQVHIRNKRQLQTSGSQENIVSLADLRLQSLVHTRSVPKVFIN